MTRIARRVVEMDAQGYNTAQIARHLHLPEATVHRILLSRIEVGS